MQLQSENIIDLSLELDPKNFAMRTPSGFKKDMQFEMEVIKEHDAPGGGIDGRRALADNQTNSMPVVPTRPIDDDFVERLVARQNRRQQDAVVVGVWLGTDDGNIEAVGSARQQFLDRPHPGHSVADDHEPRAPVVAHGFLIPPGRCGRGLRR